MLHFYLKEIYVQWHRKPVSYQTSKDILHFNLKDRSPLMGLKSAAAQILDASVRVCRKSRICIFNHFTSKLGKRAIYERVGMERISEKRYRMWWTLLSGYYVFKHFLLEWSIKVLRKGQWDPLKLEVYSTPSIEKCPPYHEINLKCCVENRNHERVSF